MAFNTLTVGRNTFVPATPTPVEKALEERNRAYKQYRRLVTIERDQLFRSSHEGQLLRRFYLTLAHFGPDAEDRLIKYVKDQSHSWLRNAPDRYRIEALRIVSERCIRNRLKLNIPPLNDPLPGEPDDTYRLCKRELGL